MNLPSDSAMSNVSSNINLQGIRPAKITVSLNWNLSNYVALNGFYPLYEFLMCGKKHSDDIEFRTIDEEKYQELMSKADWWPGQILGSGQPILARYEEGLRETAKEFWSFFSYGEALLEEADSSDVRIVHTSLVTAGGKPFIYHLEGFETLFYPWTWGDPFFLNTSNEEVRRISAYLRNVLEGPNCRAIVSHVPKTLQSIRRFFQSPIIDKKLQYSPLGFTLPDLPAREPSTKLRFLFSTSLHGGEDNLLARGLAVVLRFASMWLESHPDDEFIFITGHHFPWLSDKLPGSHLGEVLKSPNVFTFDGQFLDVGEYERLLHTCDFCLIPSLRLHSLSILKSMAHGVLPIVTDLEEVVGLGITGCNSVLVGVSDVLERSISEVFGAVLSERDFLTQSERLAKDMVDRVETLRSDLALRNTMRENAISHVAENFSAERAYVRFREVVRGALASRVGVVKPVVSEKGCGSVRSVEGISDLPIPVSRNLDAADFARRAVFRPEIDVGSFAIYGDGRRYIPMYKKGQSVKECEFFGRGLEYPTPLARRCGIGLAVDAAFDHLEIGARGEATVKQTGGGLSVRRRGPMLPPAFKGQRVLTRDKVAAPFYYNDFVLFQDECGDIAVTNCESYHRGVMDDVLFKSRYLDDCINFVGGHQRDSLGYLGRNRYLKKTTSVYRLYARLRKIFANVKKATSPTPIKIEYGGWLDPFVETQVGTHPVFEFIGYPPPGYVFTDSSGVEVRGVRRTWRLFRLAWVCGTLSLKFLAKGVAPDDIVRFWATRGLNRRSLQLRPGRKTVALYPTYLFFCPNHSWIVEIEDMLTLMSPFVPNGADTPSLTPDHPIIKIMGVLFREPSCKGVISHLQATTEGLRKLFRDEPKIVKKFRHIPLGMPLGPARHRLVKAERSRGKSKSAVRILFLNGWAGDPRAFYRRGGLDALKAFSLITDEFPDVELVVRSNLPQLSAEYQWILRNRNITVLQHKLSGPEMADLYASSDILLFPAVRIAVTTLLRAMENSLAIVASDGFGIEEYIADGVNGVIARGFRGRTGWIDETGIFRENYMLSLQCNKEVAENSAQLLRKLIRDEAYRVSLQNNARKYADENFCMAKWNERLEQTLKDLL